MLRTRSVAVHTRLDQSNVRVGQSRRLGPSIDYFRSSPGKGHCQGRSPCLKGAKPGSGLCLLDHLVRTGEKGCRNLDTEQFRWLEIDGKQEFGGVCTESLNADVVMMKSAEYRV
jgi:hypothetical protein